MSRLVSFTGLVFVLVLIRCCCSCPGNNSGEVWAGRAWSDGYVGHLSHLLVCPVCPVCPNWLMYAFCWFEARSNDYVEHPYVLFALCVLFDG